MTDKDFKQQNNYREVECCGNCKHGVFAYDIIYECGLTTTINCDETIGKCDKWEHE